MSKQFGLTEKEAKNKLIKFGPNLLPEKPPPSNFSLLISQIKNPLVYILVAAGLVTTMLHEYTDTLIILIAVFLNSALGFIQERKAGRALYALKKMIHPTAHVFRDGELMSVDVSEVVPGDVVVLNKGDKVPADAVVVDSQRLFIDEALLTGESVPLSKKNKDEIYMGTIVVSGHAKIEIITTGRETEIGKIAMLVQEPLEDTPLRKQLTTFSKQLSVLVVLMTLFVFVAGLLRGVGIKELFKTSVALSVSAIPEGLLVGLTVVLAIGMQRILKRRGLVRNLVSAETLGGVTTICIDKTGTLTLGKMKVVDIDGEEGEMSKQMLIANDLDDPIIISAYEWAKEKHSNYNRILDKYPRLDSIPFTSENRFFASLNKWERNKNIIFVNGAPEFLLSWSNLNESKKDVVRKQIEKLTHEGKRVIGLAKKEVYSSTKKISESDIQNLEWVGILAFTDPVRQGVKSALAKTRSAGIDLIVITGDYPQTAIAVMDTLGMKPKSDQVISGDKLAELSEASLTKLLKERKVTLFARTTPEQKLKIVRSLKKNGEVVAMTGDGVNDAPALNMADIGIVVGEATDVAKESADLVLLDSSFATIVLAIEEGRGIFDNIRKIILYLMSDSFEEIIAVVGTIIIGLPLPVTAAQILWINLVSDGFPNIALTVDPKASKIMQRKPRPPKQKLVSSWMRWLIFIVSSVGGLIALFVFIYFYRSTGNLMFSRSITFATLGVNSLIYVFSIRTLTQPFWKENPFSNMWLNISVVFGMFLQFVPFISPATRNFFGLEMLQMKHWALVFSLSLFMFIIIEGMKVVFGSTLKENK